MQIVIKMRELASSNLNHLMEKADNPAKMLGLLKNELQESIIVLDGEIGKSRRLAGRNREEAERIARTAEDWTNKAKAALDHKREDLARSALLVREKEQAQAGRLRAEADTLDAGAKEMAETLGALEIKLAETRDKIAATGSGENIHYAESSSGKPTDKIVDRLSRLEKRLGFAEGEAEAIPATAANIDCELEKLTRGKKVEEELAALKKATKGKNKR